MAEASTIEARVAALEMEVAELRRQVKPPETVRKWLQRVSGSFKNDPEFDEVIRLGREIRRADRPEPEA